MRAGEFRQDLFYRLAVARFVVPPLRDRPEDIVVLATQFLRRVTGDANAQLPTEIAGMLATYDWPGNVRELRNVVERFALLGERDPSRLFDAGGVAPAADEALFGLGLHEARQRVLETFDRAYVARVLEACGGVVSHAAEMAGVSRPTFYKLMDRAGLGSGR